MNNLTRTVLGLTGSILLLAVGVFRLVTESLSSTPLFVAYIFAITGLIGAIAGSFKLKLLLTKS
ncbi:hypothetical protein [Aquibacillus rhizosphaerae]|uniref:hypothetical protein n=1 Tax=Aquibacillus rhizosphaerae TaxID=3051431 RepID=UPI0038B27B61